MKKKEKKRGRENDGKREGVTWKYNFYIIAFQLSFIKWPDSSHHFNPVLFISHGKNDKKGNEKEKSFFFIQKDRKKKT